MSRLGATFVPGGVDDYYMPEVVAPAPQRVMPEVPHNMQEDLQRLELEATERDSRPASSRHHPSSADSNDRFGAAYARDGRQPDSSDFRPFHDGPSSPTAMPPPSFSPFPKVAGENIPPSDEEKEDILWQARSHVLHSNNVSMQVSWARDTLMWIEVAADARARELKRDANSERAASPKVEHELRVDAVNIIEYLAQQNHPEATFMKAKWHEFGKFGYREDRREAYAGYTKAAGMGWGRAEYRMGMLYENANDLDKAVRHYQQGAAMDDSAAHYRLGMMHLMGQHGYPKDLARGLDMIRCAADAADEDAPQGAYVYGMLICRDLPDIAIPESLLPADVAAARQYVEKAAYLSFSKAQLKMGQAYELSQLGCDFRPALSLHYYGLAARQGQPEASLGVSRWFLFGFEQVFAKNEQLAFRYAEEAAEMGLPTGEFAMGYYHEIGIHVPKDLRQARKWYQLAADHGNTDAKDRLDSLRQSKALTKQDHETTTLTRIKSQYGSQKGRRPARFARQNDAMPPVDESSAALPPQHSPGRVPPTIVRDAVDFPDPSRPMSRGSGLAMRPKSAAPYPVDPPTGSRPLSLAPYPDDDDVGPPRPLPSNNPHYNPAIRPSADRPVSAFGIRPLSQQIPPAGGPDYRGAYRPASAAPPSGYGSSGSGHDRPYPSQRLEPSASAPVAGDPNRSRLQKQPPAQYGAPADAGYGGYAAGGAPSPGYGPRTSSRPGSRPTSSGYGRVPNPPGPNPHPHRIESLPAAATAGPAGRVALHDDGPGRASAPPAQHSQKPSGPQSPGFAAGRPGAKPSASASGSFSHPDGKTVGHGPATFEEMGIPQGKKEGDCVVM